MATVKKKTKRAAASVVKSQTKAAQSAARVAKSAASQSYNFNRANADWASQNANEWAKQSAKLYQMPFASGDMNQVAQQAAEGMKSATENMMRAGSDMVSQMFGGTDPMAQWSGAFNQAKRAMPSAEDAAEKARSFGRDSAEQLSRSANNASRAANVAMELSRENAEAMVECGNLAIAVSRDIGAEIISYTNRTFSQNVELGKQLLACRTLNDMFDLSSKFMKTNLDAFFSESVKMSEKLFQCATDISEPLNERFSDSSDRLSKAIAS